MSNTTKHSRSATKYRLELFVTETLRAHGSSVRALANRMGISHATLYCILKRSYIEENRLSDMAYYLNVDVEELRKRVGQLVEIEI